MAKSWRKRLRRGRLSAWLGRIEGVERPALLVGFGLLLYRAWRTEERKLDLKSRWQGAVARMRKRFGSRSQTLEHTDPDTEARAPTSRPVPPS
jgi:hypothetical protein